MTNRLNPVRRYSRFPVKWPVLYGNDELLAEDRLRSDLPRLATCRIDAGRTGYAVEATSVHPRTVHPALYPAGNRALGTQP